MTESKIHYANAYPKVMVACSDNQFIKWKNNPFVGRLLTPVFQSSEIHRYISADNYAFIKFDAPKYVEMLRKFIHTPHILRWVTAPDVVGDCKETYKKFGVWGEVLNGFGFDVAYVLQDGQTFDSIPLSDIRCVFLGGTDDFKLSREAYRLCARCKDAGKIIHIGRVNSYIRIRRFIDVMDSFDGLSFSKFRDTHLQKLLDYLENRLK